MLDNEASRGTDGIPEDALVADVELVVDCGNTLGEGLVWDSEKQRLYWTDIEQKRLWILEPTSGDVGSIAVPERISCLAPREGGGLVVAFASGFAFFDPGTGQRDDIAPFEPELPHTRLNDGRTDRQGRLIAGGFDEVEGKAVSSVVRLDPDLHVTRLLSKVTCANGTCFSPDGRMMYFADTPAGEIWAFDYSPSDGTLGKRRTIARFDDQPGMPDGSCVDAEGFIWNAQWNGRRVVRYAPDGRIDRVLEVPVLNPTCVTFGGADLETLYITTARYLMSPAQIAAEPLSGALFACKPGVRGLPDAKFAG
ncbi:SMP-30/gluconolactonase/LRE family protein [Inquilinus limosus]|uniref:SMP-30/gluconolactonase/LRE family protein n=1 Tax=Inquilinus limosus TaxID=171674 RepID=UPI003F15913E